MTRTALLLVDLQNDFLPGGALAVPDGDAILPVAARWMAQLPLVFATQDHHPSGHASFASSHPGRAPGESILLDGLPQVLWPDHCVQGTRGADLAAGLPLGRIRQVVPKGEDPRVDSYSGFWDNGRRRETTLRQSLAGAGVSRIVVMGLATDYCMRATMLNAHELGLEVDVLVAGVRAVGLQPGDGARALAEMAAAGARLWEDDAALRASLPAAVSP